MFEQTNEHFDVPSLHLDQNNNSSILNTSQQFYSLDEKQQIKPKKKRMFLIILFIFIFLLLVGGVFFWYFKAEAMYFVYKMQFPWGDDIKNYSIESKSQIILPNDLLGEVTASLVESGLIKQEQINTIKSVDSDFSIKIVDKDIEVDTSSKLGNISILQYLLRYFYKDSIYIKADLSKILPAIPISGKWIYVPLNQDGELLKYSFIPVDQVNKYVSRISTINTRIIKDVEIIKYINISDPHETKDYNGEKIKKINFTIKKGKSIDFIFYIMKKTLSEEEYNNVYKKYQDSKTKNDEEFQRSNELLNSLENNLNISFWINKKTKAVQGMDFSIKDLDISKMSLAYNSNKQTKNISIFINSTFDELKNYKIEKPTDVIGLEEIFGSFFGTIEPVGTSTTLILSNSLKDSDKDGLLDIYEYLYNSDPRDSDTDRDGYMDGNEVLHGYNPSGTKSSDKLNDDRNIFYFAYGSNMDPEKMTLRCGERNFIGFANSYLNDFKFYFYNRGYANIKPQKSSTVYGVLYKINKNCLDGLDRAEGYPNLYQRQIVKIINPVGNFDAQVYIVKNDNSVGIPTQSYFDTVINGASQYNLPSNYIKKIRSLYVQKPIDY